MLPRLSSLVAATTLATLMLAACSSPSPSQAPDPPAPESPVAETPAPEVPLPETLPAWFDDSARKRIWLERLDILGWTPEGWPEPPLMAEGDDWQTSFEVWGSVFEVVDESEHAVQIVRTEDAYEFGLWVSRAPTLATTVEREPLYLSADADTPIPGTWLEAHAPVAIHARSGDRIQISATDEDIRVTGWITDRTRKGSFTEPPAIEDPGNAAVRFGAALTVTPKGPAFAHFALDAWKQPDEDYLPELEQSLAEHTEWVESLEADGDFDTGHRWDVRVKLLTPEREGFVEVERRSRYLRARGFVPAADFLPVDRPEWHGIPGGIAGAALMWPGMIDHDVEEGTCLLSPADLSPIGAVHITRWQTIERVKDRPGLWRMILLLHYGRIPVYLHQVSIPGWPLRFTSCPGPQVEYEDDEEEFESIDADDEDDEDDD